MLTGWVGLGQSFVVGRFVSLTDRPTSSSLQCAAAPGDTLARLGPTSSKPVRGLRAQQSTTAEAANRATNEIPTSRKRCATT